MNNKGVGAIFCLIAAILMSAKYIAASIFMSNIATKDAGMFKDGLSYVGSLPTIAAIVALVIGLLFLALGFSKDK